MERGGVWAVTDDPLKSSLCEVDSSGVCNAVQECWEEELQEGETFAGVGIDEGTL